ncbi:hypothetical protein [Bradyrhizobium sp. ARR65]|uniref:hypothetical protein n=1 Tax=Bradyrhizobium sp. ARR65 TaxID=1040989 RepID=UPI0004658A3F|nr:hypothetical protein [Bradyrhizobium sp. ARR65]
MSHFAGRLRDAPGAARLAHLARTAKRIPEPVLADLAALIAQLDHVQLVGFDVVGRQTNVGKFHRQGDNDYQTPKCARYG